MNVQELLNHTNFLISKNSDILKYFCNSNTQNKTIISRFLQNALDVVNANADNLKYYDLDDEDDFKIFNEEILTAWYTSMFNDFCSSFSKKYDTIDDWCIDVTLSKDWNVYVNIRVISNNEEKTHEQLRKFVNSRKHISYILDSEQFKNAISLVDDFI